MNKLTGFISLTVFIIVTIILTELYIKRNTKIMNLNYIITETVAPDSFDPLLADSK